MDILDLFWTFYLYHLNPLWGYFWNFDLLEELLSGCEDQHVITYLNVQ